MFRQRWFAGLFLAALVVGCGAPITSTPPPVTDAPTVTQPPQRTDAERTRILQDSILEVFGEDPQPDWYEYLGMTDGRPDVLVEASSLFVGVAPSIPDALAAELCSAMALVAFDDEGEPIGFRSVHVQAGVDDFRADCDI